MTAHKENSVLKWVYIWLTAISCLSIYKSTEWTKLKLASVLFIVIALLHFMLYFKSKHIKTLWGFLWRYSIFLIILLDISLFINVITESDISLIKSGVVKIFYQFLTVFVAISAVYVFEDKAVDYTFWGFALFNFLAILIALSECGINGAVWSIQKFVTTGGDADGFMKRLELHDATFAFGLFLIHYFVAGIKTHKAQFLIGLFFFVIGFKRIGLGGLVLAILLSEIMKTMKEPNAVVFGRVVMLAFAIAGAGCVIMIRSGLFEYIMNELNIDMMGRQNLFKYIENFYELSPRFIGHGFESIRYILSQAGNVKVNNTYIARMSAIHSDYLRMYIELGFWGFAFWEWYTFVFMPKEMTKFSFQAFVVYVACTAYLAFTYFTDNTAMFFLVSVAYRMIPPGMAVTSRKEANPYE